MSQQLTTLRVMSDEFFENSFSEYIIAISILQFPGFTAHENLYSTNIKNSLQCKAALQGVLLCEELLNLMLRD